ncbi:MAG TPA: helix-hairpin-helix domain-containing protein [Burkholderiaceae bacterium]|nr:helix-hairpin-helix domain-containing protein [Burkholderiaceae bacterium]
MLKKILAIVAMLYAAAAFAAVDVNKATAAELDGIKGIGPGISAKILDERKKGNFKDWNDFIERVKGIGETNAAKFSAEGVTVGGASYKGAPAAPAAKLEMAKPAAAAAPAATAAPAAAPAAKADPKAEAKMKAEEEKKAKAAAKAKAAEEKKAKKEADMKAKEEAKAKKAEKPAAKADAAKPAASAAKK